VTDLITRLRKWTIMPAASPASDLMDEAADEIERLSRTGSNDAKTGDDATERCDQGVKCPERDRLEELRTAADLADAEYREEISRLRITDAEREAVERAADLIDAKTCGDSSTLRSLLARLSPPAT
jgi:hypothetical protein